MSAYDEDRDDWHADDWRRQGSEGHLDKDEEDYEDWIDPDVEFDLYYYGIPWNVARRTAVCTVVALSAYRFGLGWISWVWEFLRYAVPGVGGSL